MQWEKDCLDLILVPSGLFIMFGYHIFLLYRYLTNYKSTSIGYENHNKKAWAKGMMQLDTEKSDPAFTVIGRSITATFMASTSLVLTSLIGTLMGSTSSSTLVTKIVYGDTKATTASIKYISVLFFFLIAFVCFVRCSRVYDLVVEALVHGSNFWHVGLREVYFAIVLLIWVFGPIPMFVSSLAMVIVLHVLDVNKRPLHDFHGKLKERTDV